MIQGLIHQDVTGGANHYLNPYACVKLPKWGRRTDKITTVIGKHTFYRF